jgi:alanine-synthesizing transaminase
MARAAIACDYERHGIKVAPDRIVLTASTSEAYSVLFKLLCAPDGDAVMLPVPSYPLFDHLTQLDGVRPIPYMLEYHGRWEVDFETLDAGWTGSVRAVLAVSPNNPTGSVLSEGEFMALAGRCASREAALVVDEVFIDYPLSPRPAPSVARPPCLTFRLGGLSKSAGLPQVKLGWILFDGPDALVRTALDRLELICDT